MQEIRNSGDDQWVNVLPLKFHKPDSEVTPLAYELRALPVVVPVLFLVELSELPSLYPSANPDLRSLQRSPSLSLPPGIIL